MFFITRLTQDCAYLVGLNPSSGASTSAMLGPYLTGTWSYSCQTVSSTSGTQLLWSALYVQITFVNPSPLNVLAVNVNANINNVWNNIATQSYPYGLAGPVGENQAALEFAWGRDYVDMD